jgi:hypothetical protein
MWSSAACGGPHKRADEAAEKKLKFSLRTSLHRAQQKRLLEGTAVIFWPGAC